MPSEKDRGMAIDNMCKTRYCMAKWGAHRWMNRNINIDVDDSTYLFLLVAAGEQCQFLAKDLLLVQHFLVVDVLEQVRVVDAVGTQELSVCHLERLTYRLRDQLSLQSQHHICHWIFTCHITLNNYNKSPGYCRETARRFVSWNVSRCMVNATDCVNLRSTFCLSPFLGDENAPSASGEPAVLQTTDDQRCWWRCVSLRQLIQVDTEHRGGWTQINIWAVRRLSQETCWPIEKSLFCLSHPALRPPLRGTPLEFLDETNPEKLEGWGYCMVKTAWS